MLQRAANNAYSWWWASHIRTKQSKWLDQSLLDMEEKVQNMLKLIEEDGDSFAKRAEMYYKRRPELITSVEEAYKAFRALADRYDLLSKELQNANHTIATVFPEQVQFAMDEDDESVSAKMTKNSQIPDIGNAPNAPKAPIKDLKGLITTASKQLQANKLSKTNKVVQKSGLTKEEAVEEIDKLQKDILALQTVKEFARSTYESGLSKYWGIENQIMEMQQNICRLQDEFNVDTVIEDDEARTLMAEAALKSCQETLIQLQDKQERSAIEAREESLKIEAAHGRLESLKKEFLNDGTNEEKMNDNDMISNFEDESQSSTIDVVEVIQEMESVEASSVKLREDLESLTVTEMAEKIDKLVNKVITLETVVSSQTVLINTLRTEADDLHSQIQRLEDEKVTLINSTHILTTRLKEMEEKLRKLQDLNKNLESQNRNLQTNFADARNSLDHLSEKLSSIKPDEEQEETSSVQDESAMPSPGGGEKFLNNSKTEGTVDVKEIDTTVEGTKSSGKSSTKKTVTFLDQKQKEQILVDHSDDLINARAKENVEKEEELNWQQMLLTGMEDREKILLKEYTTILRNYKDVKKKLGDMEKQERDSQFDIIVQMRELKDAVAKRDEEIHRLRQKLNLLQENKDITVDYVPDERGVKPEAGGDDLQENSLINKEGDIKLVFIDRTSPISAVEEKLRMDIDAILDENLDFWLRFSTAFHQIQKFKTEVQDLQDEILKLLEKKMQVGSVTTEQKSEVRPIYKHLREIQTELTVWLEQSVSLKDEQKRRFASLCSIQEEITKALKEGVEGEEIRFSSHQAAKFQGEILNMKQENNKVRDELQAGLDHVSTLQLDIEKSLRKLNEEFGICGDQQQLKQAMSRSRIPLRSFIFGTKLKKQKHSILSCMHPNRRFPLMRGGTHS
ncbi:kinase-interacting protein 1-like [Primulina huaijiensis]|uniref:kinase-interacting protein 1-like n=1 Tax=Primulina huaijiensis TaxID=1492673 RepID=UPI003CC74FB3